MSKFLLNLILQISKALVNSKIQFLIQKFFFLTFSPADLMAHSAFGPAHPLASLAPQAETAPAGPPIPCVDHVFMGIHFPFWFAPSELAASPLVSLPSGAELSVSSSSRAGRPLPLSPIASGHPAPPDL
jgi:hypothetical protein